MMDDKIESGRKVSEQLMPFERGDPWKKSTALLDMLLEAKRKKEPFSMVRFGDGEGRILGYPLFYNDELISHRVLTYQYGKKVISLLKGKYSEDYIFHGVMTLKYGLIKAACNADIIGLPSWLHFRGINDKNKDAMFSQALALTELERFIKDKKIFDHFIFRPFQMDNNFNDLLSDLDYLGFIAHSDISTLIKDKFNIKHVVHYKIPGHQTFMRDDEPQYPNIYKKIIENIVVPYRGAIFLVAAGYLGKIYCNEIKIKGGIAIDIGAIFDAWTGTGRDDETKNKHLRL
jgi:hypothetical protein